MQLKTKSKVYVALIFFTLLLSSCKAKPSSEVIPSSNEPSTSEPSVTSDIVTSVPSEEDSLDSSTSLEDIGNEYFIDDDFYRDFYYNPASYDIAEYIPLTNPYEHIVTNEERNAFYSNNYNRAASYEDAMFRTQKFLISGDIKDTPFDLDYDLNHLPNRWYRHVSNIRINEGIYEYDGDGNYKSYTINNLEGKVKKIYYGAAYVSLDDVAAYLFAFGEGPANYHQAKNRSAQREMINLWGQYGRVNDDYYNSDVTHYLYEPSLPHTDNGGEKGENMYKYHELDFGYTKTPWGYGVLSHEPYNNGESINRGTVRFVYSASTYEGERGAKYIPVEHRHVFLTFNHYNDFVEYLNYEGGWGAPFGWMTAGNEYVAGMDSSVYGPGYYEFDDPYPPSKYPVPEVLTLNELQNILNVM